MLGFSRKSSGGNAGSNGAGQPIAPNPTFPASAIYRARAAIVGATAHHHNENLKTQRAIVRKQNGLDMEDSMYLPNSQTAVTNNNSPGWGGVLLGAGLAAAGLITGGGIMYAGLGAREPQQVPAVTKQVMAPMEYDEVEQILQPDGTWKPTGKSQRKRLMLDGTVQVRGADGSWK